MASVLESERSPETLLEARASSCPKCALRNGVHRHHCHVCGATLEVALIADVPGASGSIETFAELIAGEDKGEALRVESVLRAGQGTVVTHLSLLEAMALLLLAREYQVSLSIEPVGRGDAPTTGSPPPRSWTNHPLTAFGVLGLIAAFIVGGFHSYRWLSAPPADAGQRWHSATVRPGRIVPSDASRDDLPPLPTPGMASEISRATIESARSAVVRVSVPQGVATGFFVSSDGLIVTNHHVVAGTKRIQVSADGQIATARVIRAAPSWDLALLESGLPAPAYLEIADSTALEPAASVFTIGSAEGLEGSVRVGRVSYVGRAIDAISVLELDLAVTGGSSGGPIIDSAGRVVGIVNATLTTSARTSYAVLSNYLNEGSDALLRGRLPTVPLRARFLELQLAAMIDVGRSALPNRVWKSSHAFVTASRFVAAVAESEGPVFTTGEYVAANIWIRDRAGRVLLEEVVEARTSDSSARSIDDRTALAFFFELTPEEYDAIRLAGAVILEVRYVPFRLRRLLPLRVG